MPAQKAPDPKLRRKGGARVGRNVGGNTAAKENREALPSRKIDLGGLDRRLGYLLRRAQMAVFRDFIQGLSKYDIRPAQFSVLTVIEANPGLSQGELARTLAIEPARLVLMLDELERRGLCRRTPAPNDRRSRALVLTPKGTEQLSLLIELAEEHEARVLATLNATERRQILVLLQALLPD